jgi:hypothetical protein
MAERAQVTSVEAIASFRADLILYLNKARPALEEISSDVLRTRLWIQNDRRSYWENQFKLRGRALERAQSELFGARLSKIQTASAAQQMAVIKARNAVREAETKLRILRKWDRELEHRSEPLVKQLDQLHGFLATDMVKAVAYLAQVVRTLDAYAGVALPGGETSSAAPVEDASTPAPSAAEPPAGAGTGGEKPS